MKIFAASDEGQKIAFLDMNGYKLACTQKELTPLQSLFLFYALPQMMKRMSGAKNHKEEQKSYLRQRIEERQKGVN